MSDDKSSATPPDAEMANRSTTIVDGTSAIEPAATSLHASRAGRAPRKRASPPGTGAGPRYQASIYPGPGHLLPVEFCKAVVELERLLGMPMWLLVQGTTDHARDYEELNDTVAQGFIDAEHDLQPDQEVALLLHSYGGFADSAYAIARVLRNSSGGFTAVVPRYAKSAATLLVLGASGRIMGRHAELGPLDAQILDPEREDVTSALNEVQSLERLNAFAMQAVDEWMFLLKPRTRKRTETLLPMVMQFVGEMMRPLVDKIDTVHYTQNSRLLKVAEEYAVRLLQPQFSPESARRIASRLIERYPDHSFAIYAEEVQGLGLEVTDPTTEQDVLLEQLARQVPRMVVIGRLTEVKP